MMDQLWMAAAAGDAQTVERLVSAQPDLVIARDGHGDTALALAARWGHATLVASLLARGADPNAARTGRDEGVSPLEWACTARGTPEIVALLLQHGADPRRLVHHHGAAPITVLHTAARYGHTEIVRLLLAHGADPATTCGGGDYGYQGLTPLQVAAKEGHRSTVDLLRSAGETGDAPMSASP
jgi:ankyrin repeat protein